MIEVSALRRTFGSVVAVNDISFTVDPGSVLGFLGPNGAGKSTTLRILAGFLAPTAGTVRVGGVDVADPSADFRRSLGYLPESAPSYHEMKVRPYLAHVARLHRVGDVRAAVEAVVDQVGLRPMVGRRIATLSKGYRQRVGLAAALVHDPAVVVLDEPTSGLDPNQIVEIRDVIRALGSNKTVVFSSHRLAEVEAVADRVLVLNHGKVVADSSLAALRRPAGTYVQATVQATDAEAVAAALAELGQVDARSEDGLVHVVVRSERDVRAEVARALARWPLLELTAPTSGLAEIFRDLTSAA